LKVNGNSLILFLVWHFSERNLADRRGWTQEQIFCLALRSVTSRMSISINRMLKKFCVKAWL